MLRVHLSVAGVLDLTVVVGEAGAAMQIVEDDQARERESRAREESERRRRLAAARLIDRFRRSGRIRLRGPRRGLGALVAGLSWLFADCELVWSMSARARPPRRGLRPEPR